MISIDVVGGVQKLAEDWAAADEDLREANNLVDKAKREVDIARSRLAEASKRLSERVGSNVPLKVYRVGIDAVIVEHERGIRRVEIEAAK